MVVYVIVVYPPFLYIPSCVLTATRISSFRLMRCFWFKLVLAFSLHLDAEIMHYPFVLPLQLSGRFPGPSCSSTTRYSWRHQTGSMLVSASRRSMHFPVHADLLCFPKPDENECTSFFFLYTKSALVSDETESYMNRRLNIQNAELLTAGTASNDQAEYSQQLALSPTGRLISSRVLQRVCLYRVPTTDPQQATASQ